MLEWFSYGLTSVAYTLLGSTSRGPTLTRLVLAKTKRDGVHRSPRLKMRQNNHKNEKKK